MWEKTLQALEVRRQPGNHSHTMLPVAGNLGTLGDDQLPPQRHQALQAGGVKRRGSDFSLDLFLRRLNDPGPNYD